jgi:hypothetical protein
MDRRGAGTAEAGRTLTPWVANGALSLNGQRHRIGGLSTRGLQVQESAAGCLLSLPGQRGVRVQARVDVPQGSAAGWLYADPDGGRHDVVNCSVAAMELRVEQSDRASATTLQTPHGGAYELGMRTPAGADPPEHGVAMAPFADV